MKTAIIDEELKKIGCIAELAQLLHIQKDLKLGSIEEARSFVDTQIIEGWSDLQGDLTLLQVIE